MFTLSILLGAAWTGWTIISTAFAYQMNGMVVVMMTTTHVGNSILSWLDILVYYDLKQGSLWAFAQAKVFTGQKRWRERSRGENWRNTKPQTHILLWYDNEIEHVFGKSSPSSVSNITGVVPALPWSHRYSATAYTYCQAILYFDSIREQTIHLFHPSVPLPPEFGCSNPTEVNYNETGDGKVSCGLLELPSRLSKYNR